MSDYTWNPFAQQESYTQLNIEQLKSEVAKYFPIYDIKYNVNTVAFFCNVDKKTLEEKFDLLRRSLSEKGYIPILKYEQGEHIIFSCTTKP